MIVRILVRLFFLLVAGVTLVAGVPAWAQKGGAGAPLVSEAGLKATMKAALREERWDKAIEAGIALDALVPDDFDPAHGLARAYARKGDVPTALTWLQKSAERGYFDLSELINETDLDGLRDQQAFVAVLDRVRKNNAESLKPFRPVAEKAQIITLLPANHDKSKPAPLLVALHGLGGNAEAIAGVWKKAADDLGAIVIAPQSPYKITEYGFDWLVIEHAELLVLLAIEKAKAGHAIDTKRIAITGYSQGGVMAFAIALRNPEVFAGAIPVAAYWDARYTPIPEKPTALPRFAILNGAGDSAADNNREAASRLQSIGSPVLLKIYDGLGHSFPRKDRDDELKKAMEFALDGR